MLSPPALSTATVLLRDSPWPSLDGSQPSTQGLSIQASRNRSGAPHLGLLQQLDDLGLRLVCRVLSRLLRRRRGSREPGESCEKRLRGHRDRPVPAPPPPPPPGRPRPERTAHLPTAAAPRVRAPARLGSAAAPRPAPRRPPAPAAGAPYSLRTAGPRPAAGFDPDASEATGTCRPVLRGPLAAAGSGRPPTLPSARMRDDACRRHAASPRLPPAARVGFRRATEEKTGRGLWRSRSRRSWRSS